MDPIICAYTRWYHTTHSPFPIFFDDKVHLLFTEKELLEMGFRLAMQAVDDYPGIEGTEEEALAKIVNEQFAPTVLMQSAFFEDCFRTAYRLGCRQCVLLDAGNDTFSLRHSAEGVAVFELDHVGFLTEKISRLNREGVFLPSVTIPYDIAKDDCAERLKNEGFCPNQSAIGNLLGVTERLQEEQLRALLKNLAAVWCEGSCLVMDFSLSEYTEREMECLLSDGGFRVYEALDFKTAESRFFAAHNLADTANPLYPPKNCGYLLAVRKPLQK